MTATHELLNTLRRLKMSGMLDTLEVRLDQARAGELGHLEFLQVLCEDELTRRDASALARRVRAAHFDEIATLEDFDFAYNPKIPVAAIRDLATLGFVEAHESVIVYGPVGVGKSHIAQALGHLACRRGHTVTFAKANRVLADLSGGHADGSWLGRLRRWARPDVLVIDDFGLRPFTAAQADDFYELVCERRRSSLISRPTVNPLTGMGSSPTPLSQKEFSTASSTRPTTSSWTARAIDRRNDPADDPPRPPRSPGREHRPGPRRAGPHHQRVTFTPRDPGGEFRDGHPGELRDGRQLRRGVEPAPGDKPDLGDRIDQRYDPRRRDYRARRG